jgi:AcrR family transcriptional regulator
MSSKTSAAPRERLLSAANKLFYDEGIHTVGIDRVIDKAGVAKASLYTAFGSKDELVRAYLQGRLETRKTRVEQAIARRHTPRERALAVFDLLGELVADPGFRGCAFLRASAEGPPDKRVKSVCDDSRAWLRSRFVELARDAGAGDPERVAGRLVLLYDGAVVAAQMDRDPSAATAARDMAAGVLDDETRKARAHVHATGKVAAPAKGPAHVRRG